MDEKRIHIVSFNVPYPANYGGVIDVFHKLKALSENGVKIVLHAFVYGRKPAVELEKYCEKVYYYKRNTGFLSQLSMIPYIVYSRRNKQLLADLLNDDAPILFEGLHCCYYLNHSLLKDRLKIVRAHNIESVYYSGLAKNSVSIFKKLYFKLETWRLKRYEKILSEASYILAISTLEKSYFDNKFGKNKSIYVPAFFQTPQFIPASQSETKPFTLYHGDLNSPENRKAVDFLMNSVASKDESIFWIFAGLNPSKDLLKSARKYKNVTMLANLSEEKMSQIIGEASIHILFTNQISGLKIKILHALAGGRYCLANKEMVEGSGLEKLCRIISSNPDEILENIRECLQNPLNEREISERKEIFNTIYDNTLNVLKIKALLH